MRPRAVITSLLLAVLTLLTACNRDYDLGDNLPEGGGDDAPIIFLPVPAQGVTMLTGSTHTFTPDITSQGEGALSVVWSVDGVVAATDLSFDFTPTTPGQRVLTITATDTGGTSKFSFIVNVVDRLPSELTFITPETVFATDTRYTIPGRPIYLAVRCANLHSPRYSWSVNGEAIDCDRPALMFTPDSPGQYEVTVTASDGTDRSEASVRVVCLNTTEGEIMRPASGVSSPSQSAVLEYIPAPGQFINDTRLAGFTGTEYTHAQACEYARRRLEGGAYVTLGAFGGYITVVMDHSVKAGGGQYDFAIRGNSYLESNEPGVVWVSQDLNRNGLPDDEWYELQSSEPAEYYSVTYFLPAAPCSRTRWIDFNGAEGAVNYNGNYHPQDYYYPLWIDTQCYTLSGKKIASTLYLDDANNQWVNPPRGWGYADNTGIDSWYDGAEQWTGFSIANAVYPDGTPARLDFVDFIRVQSAVMDQAPGIGEVSCEVLGFKDMSIR